MLGAAVPCFLAKKNDEETNHRPVSPKTPLAPCRLASHPPRYRSQGRTMTHVRALVWKIYLQRRRRWLPTLLASLVPVSAFACGCPSPNQCSCDGTHSGPPSVSLSHPPPTPIRRPHPYLKMRLPCVREDVVGCFGGGCWRAESADWVCRWHMVAALALPTGTLAPA